MSNPFHWPSTLETHAAAAETIARRLPILWWGMMWPSPSAHAEARHMVIEKQMAVLEGLFAVQVELLSLAFKPWWWAHMPHDAMRGVAEAATAPAARRAKANARRLRGR